MTTTAAHIVEEFKRLTPAEKREVFQAIVQEVAPPTVATGKPRKTIAEVAGKYRPIPAEGMKDHDIWFAEAIMASKGRKWS